MLAPAIPATCEQLSPLPHWQAAEACDEHSHVTPFFGGL
jgi:hypothetical protein